MAGPYGFLAEYPSFADDPSYDGFEEYLNDEFGKHDPAWEPRFGRSMAYDEVTDKYNYSYVLTGDVPDAESHEQAQSKVQEILDNLARDFKKLPKPSTRVWKHEAPSEP